MQEFLKTISILLILLDRSQPSVMKFTETAQTCHQNLLSENKLLAKKRLEKDIRIAAIVLANNGIMVTRNHKDFSLIPNLQIEDWTD